jgi:hypothetical protein
LEFSVSELANFATEEFEELRRTSRQIRLLTIEPGDGFGNIICTLSPVRLRDAPKYEALSYAWGNLDDTRTIVCDGEEIKVTANLYAALRQLRNLTPPELSGLTLYVLTRAI